VSDENVEAVRRGWEAIAAGDFNAIADVLAPEVTWRGGNRRARGAYGNRDQVLEFMRQTQQRARVSELIDLIDIGEQVVVVMRVQPAGGGEPELRANLTTFRDGKVIEMVAFETPAAALAATQE